VQTQQAQEAGPWAHGYWSCCRQQRQRSPQTSGKTQTTKKQSQSPPNPSRRFPNQKNPSSSTTPPQPASRSLVPCLGLFGGICPPVICRRRTVRLPPLRYLVRSPSIDPSALPAIHHPYLFLTRSVEY